MPAANLAAGKRTLGPDAWEALERVLAVKITLFAQQAMTLPQAFTNQVLCADVMATLDQLPDGCLDLVFGDPDYNVGVDYAGFALRMHPHMLAHPLNWKNPLRIFVNSMSDLLHPAVSLEYIKRVFAVMRQANWHQFQVLTKRSERLLECAGQLDWQPHIWIGVSVENQEHMPRIEHLRNTGAQRRFLSLEPLLGPLPSLTLQGIDWVIVEGESGPGARSMQKEWVLDIRQQCQGAGAPFFFKQWGGVNKKKTGRLLDGRTWEEMPSKNPR